MAEHACVPVINALSELEHPCQALADYFTLQERFGDLKKIMPGLRRRRQQRAAFAAADARRCWDRRFASPRLKAMVRIRRFLPTRTTIAKKTGATIELMTDPHQAVDGADAIYTDAWTSMGHEHETEERDQNFPALPGQREADGGSGAARGFHALLARASQRRSHGRGHGFRAIRGLRPGGKSHARAESDINDADRRQRAACP